MLGRHELLVLWTEVELALVQRDTGTSRCSSRAVAMEIFRRFSWVTAARLDVLVDVDVDDDKVEVEEGRDGEDDKEEEQGKEDDDDNDDDDNV